MFGRQFTTVRQRHCRDGVRGSWRLERANRRLEPTGALSGGREYEVSPIQAPFYAIREEKNLSGLALQEGPIRAYTTSS